MISGSIERLRFLCETIPPLLLAKDEKTMSAKPELNKWSKKEILGHLIDSAANNHHRFVRGQFETEPSISYNQDQWNAHGYYNHVDSRQLIALWEAYNRQMAALLQHMPPEKLQNKVHTGAHSHTIEYLFEDYVIHLEHHLHQLVDY